MTKKKKRSIYVKKQSRNTDSLKESSSDPCTKPSCCSVSSPPEKATAAAAAAAAAPPPGGSDQPWLVCASSYGLLGLALMENPDHKWYTREFLASAATAAAEALRRPASVSCGWRGGRRALETTGTAGCTSCMWKHEMHRRRRGWRRRRRRRAASSSWPWLRFHRPRRLYSSSSWFRKIKWDFGLNKVMFFWIWVMRNENESWWNCYMIIYRLEFSFVSCRVWLHICWHFEGGRRNQRI